jgi:hypothetical protein
MYGVESFKIQVSGVYSVAADLYLRFVLHVMLFCMLGIFCTLTSVLAKLGYTVPIMAALCITFILCYPIVWHTFCLNDFEVVTVVSVITGITFAFTFTHALNFCYKIFIF